MFICTSLGHNKLENIGFNLRANFVLHCVIIIYFQMFVAFVITARALKKEHFASFVVSVTSFVVLWFQLCATRRYYYLLLNVCSYCDNSESFKKGAFCIFCGFSNTQDRRISF